jgi:hypothetical protein
MRDQHIHKSEHVREFTGKLYLNDSVYYLNKPCLRSYSLEENTHQTTRFRSNPNKLEDSGQIPLN